MSSQKAHLKCGWSSSKNTMLNTNLKKYFNTIQLYSEIDDHIILLNKISSEIGHFTTDKTR